MRMAVMVVAMMGVVVHVAVIHADENARPSGTTQPGGREPVPADRATIAN